MKKWYKLPTSLICSVFLGMTTATIVNAQETTTTEPAYSANLEATSKSTALLSDEEILQKLAEQGMDPNEPGFNKNTVDNHDDSYRGVDPSTESEEDTLSPVRKKRAIADDCQTYGGAIALPGFPQYTLCGEIKDKYNSVGGQQSFLLAPKSGMILNPDGVGMRAEFVNGFIYWHPETGAHIVSTHFSAAWQAHGWESGVLGYPTSDEYDVPRFGRKQEFQHGHIYGSFTGVYAIGGAIYDKWIEYAAENGMGFPVTNMTFAPDGIGRFQTLERGTIYWHPQFGAHPLWGEIWVNWAAQGFEKGLGYPTSDPVNVDERLTQTFERGQLGMYSDKILDLMQWARIYESSEIDSQYQEMIDWYKANGVKISEGFSTDWNNVVENERWMAGESNITSEERGSFPIHYEKVKCKDRNDPTLTEADPVFYFPTGNDIEEGDIIISKVSRLGGAEHGHAAIYVKKHNDGSWDLIESAGKEAPLRKVNTKQNTGYCYPEVYRVRTSAEKRKDAAEWATQQYITYETDKANRRPTVGYHLTGSKGNIRKNPAVYNCASFVWAAYNVPFKEDKLDIQNYSSAYWVTPHGLKNSSMLQRIK